MRDERRMAESPQTAAPQPLFLSFCPVELKADPAAKTLTLALLVLIPVTPAESPVVLDDVPTTPLPEVLVPSTPVPEVLVPFKATPLVDFPPKVCPEAKWMVPLELKYSRSRSPMTPGSKIQPTCYMR
jgi:hypothetical protein